MPARDNASMVASLFDGVAARKLGFNLEKLRLSADLFSVPGRENAPVQLALL